MLYNFWWWYSMNWSIRDYVLNWLTEEIWDYMWLQFPALNYYLESLYVLLKMRINEKIMSWTLYYVHVYLVDLTMHALTPLRVCSSGSGATSTIQHQDLCLLTINCLIYKGVLEKIVIWFDLRKLEWVFGHFVTLAS